MLTERFAFDERATICLTINQVRNVPINEKIQRVYVAVRYEEKDLQHASCNILSHTYGSTDSTTIKQGEKTHVYSWSEKENHEIELAYDPFYIQQGKDATIKLEVWKDEFKKIQTHTKDILIGSAALKLKDLVTATSPAISIPIQGTQNEQYQGEIDMKITFGKPLRKAYLALSRLAVIFEMRDTIIRRLCSMVFMLYSCIASVIKAHPKLSVGVGIGLVAILLGILSISMFFIIPALFMIFVTFPLWIVPVSVGTFFTAPLWLPLIFITVLCGVLFLMFLVTVALTSRKIRKTAFFYLSRFKKTPLGQRLFYE